MALRARSMASVGLPPTLRSSRRNQPLATAASYWDHGPVPGESNAIPGQLCPPACHSNGSGEWSSHSRRCPLSRTVTHKERLRRDPLIVVCFYEALEQPHERVTDMGVSLSKGGNVSLTKEAPNLTAVAVGLGRSEEHTSELQSLMRISYAVFCLKKKKIKKEI